MSELLNMYIGGRRRVAQHGWAGEIRCPANTQPVMVADDAAAPVPGVRVLSTARRTPRIATSEETR